MKLQVDKIACKKVAICHNGKSIKGQMFFEMAG